MILNGNHKLIPKIIDNEDIKEIYEMIGMFILELKNNNSKKIPKVKFLLLISIFTQKFVSKFHNI